MQGSTISNSPSKISDSRDTHIQCYNRKNYELGFDAKAIGWFVQFAVRTDLEAADRGLHNLNNADVDTYMLTYGEISDRIDDLKNLIRDKHVIDEPRLETIGLSLYSFPTLARFFGNEKAFVRQAAVHEIETTLKAARSHIERLNARLQEANNELEIDSDDDIVDSLADFTPSQVKSAACLEPEDILDELLFIVDLSAPTPVLVDQFRKAVEQVRVRKDCGNDLSYEWLFYGVLPYLDLNCWRQDNPEIGVSQGAQVALILSQRSSKGELSPKTIQDKTKPRAENAMDSKTVAFASLRTAASLQFADAIAFARGTLDGADSDHVKAAKEILARWLPQTYPVNFSRSRQTAIVMPDMEDSWEGMRGVFATNGFFEMETVERIRKFCSNDWDKHENAQLDRLRRLGEKLGF
jgi:hypothetical protein